MLGGANVHRARLLGRSELPSGHRLLAASAAIATAAKVATAAIAAARTPAALSAAAAIATAAIIAATALSAVESDRNRRGRGGARFGRLVGARSDRERRHHHRRDLRMCRVASTQAREVGLVFRKEKNCSH